MRSTMCGFPFRMREEQRSRGQPMAHLDERSPSLMDLQRHHRDRRDSANDSLGKGQ